eukprot:9777924-Karenia_brevis.AAC.1
MVAVLGIFLSGPCRWTRSEIHFSLPYVLSPCISDQASLSLKNGLVAKGPGTRPYGPSSTAGQAGAAHPGESLPCSA